MKPVLYCVIVAFMLAVGATFGGYQKEKLGLSGLPRDSMASQKLHYDMVHKYSRLDTIVVDDDGEYTIFQIVDFVYVDLAKKVTDQGRSEFERESNMLKGTKPKYWLANPHILLRKLFHSNKSNEIDIFLSKMPKKCDLKICLITGDQRLVFNRIAMISLDTELPLK